MSERIVIAIPTFRRPNSLARLLDAVALLETDAALSVLVQHNLPVAYTAAGQCVPDDIDLADARYLAGMLELPRRGATSTSSDEGHHAFG